MSGLTIADPAAIAALVDDGLAHHRAGRLAQAEAAYRRVLEVEPDNADALHLFGVLAHQTGDNELAATLIEKAVTLRPNAADFHSNLGIVYHALGDWDRAAAAHRRALELDPDRPDSHYNLATIYFGGFIIFNVVVLYLTLLYHLPKILNIDSNDGEEV